MGLLPLPRGPVSPPPGWVGDLPDRRLVVARHGRTAWNAEGRFQGHGNPPLDEVGRVQAEVLATSLASLPGLAVSVVASSDLRRARQTGEIVARALGVALTVAVDLREADLGAWEGLRGDEVAHRFPDEWAAWQAGEDPRRGGGESLAGAGRRVAAALRRLTATAVPGTATVAVGHGLALQAALDALATDGAVDLLLPASHLGNGEWLDLRLKGADALLGAGPPLGEGHPTAS